MKIDINRQKSVRYFKSHYFSWSSRTDLIWYLKNHSAGKTGFHVLKTPSLSLRSKRFRASSSRKVGTRAKEKKEWRRRGRGEKGTLARKPHDFEKLRSPTNAASDWCGAGSVDYLTLETSIKPGMLCLRASQIWSYLICGRRLQLLWTDMNRVCAKVYEIRV